MLNTRIPPAFQASRGLTLMDANQNRPPSATPQTAIAPTIGITASGVTGSLPASPAVSSGTATPQIPATVSPAPPVPPNVQAKRMTEDLATPVAKRPKTEGIATPGLMGPPSTAVAASATKKKDDGLDEGDPNDVFGGAGINLQDEERNMTAFEVPRKIFQPSQQQQGQDTGEKARKSNFLDTQALQYMVNKKLSDAGLSKADGEIHGLISMAIRERLTSIISRMIVLSKHRCAAPPEAARPIDDVGRILRSISLKEAQDEERRRTIAAARRAEEDAKRREADEALNASKKKSGIAKTLSEQVIARNANATAQMMLNQSGGKKYSWMTGAPNTSQLPRRNTTLVNPVTQAMLFKAGSDENIGQITMKDFINAMEMDGEDMIGRGGKTLLRAYTLLKD